MVVYSCGPEGVRDIIATMKRALASLAALIAIFAITACASEERKPTQESVMAEQAMSIAEALRSAYASGNTSMMSDYCTAAGYDEIRRGLKPFSSVKLEFEPEWMDVDLDSTVKLRIKWKGTWKLENGKESQHEGRAVFVMQGQPLKLTSIKRSNPFDMPRELIQR